MNYCAMSGALVTESPDGQVVIVVQYAKADT